MPRTIYLYMVGPARPHQTQVADRSLYLCMCFSHLASAVYISGGVRLYM